MSNLFAQKPPPPPPTPPTPTPPPTMPDPMSPAALAARRKAIAGVGGRQSTILTTAGSRAGATLAGSYGGQKLGAS